MADITYARIQGISCRTNSSRNCQSYRANSSYFQVPSPLAGRRAVVHNCTVNIFFLRFRCSQTRLEFWRSIARRANWFCGCRFSPMEQQGGRRSKSELVSGRKEDCVVAVHLFQLTLHCVVLHKGIQYDNIVTPITRNLLWIFCGFG